MTIHLMLDGQKVSIKEGQSVLDVINVSGTFIPQLCKDPDMKPIGACRTCIVEIDGIRGMPASCSTPAVNGMVVSTNSPGVQRIRKGILDLTLGMVGDGTELGLLRQACDKYGLSSGTWVARYREDTDTSNPVFDISMGACILCARCVNACQDSHQFIGAIDHLGAGTESRIGTFMDKPLIESICTTCGQCLSVCPTGAIHPKSSLPRQRSGKEALPVLNTVASTCPYCGVGCGIQISTDADENIVEVYDDPDNLSSVGMLCVKGRFGQGFVTHPDRLKEPLIRRDGVLKQATWDDALDLISSKLINYRGDSFGTLCSAKATNEDGYVQQKFTRLVMKSNNIDHCTRLCHSPSVEAMLESLGSGATSNSYSDYEDARCLVVIGCDPTSNHPVAASRMRRAIVERGAKLIVINPRRIDMCDYADIWLRPMPGTDVALLNGIANVIIKDGLLDSPFVMDRTEGYDDWYKIIEEYNPKKVEDITGIAEQDLIDAARTYANPPPTRSGPGLETGGSCLIWGMGITQHTNGTANAHGLLNLALVSGQIGKRGAGISPLRGQNNVQGCGDSGCLPDNLPGYQGLRPESLRKFEDAWGGNLPSTKGLVVTEMVESIGKSDGIKAMYITGENPLLSEPDLNHAEKMFAQLDFLVVQDIFLHETAAIADVVLPAVSYAEKDGTFTNSERRVQRIRKAISPLGKGRADWEIISELAVRVSEKLGLGLEHQFLYENPEQIFAEMSGLTPIIAGINYQRIQKSGIQWPCPEVGHPGTEFLYEETFPRGDRAKFVAFDQGPVAAERPNKRFPIMLNTGRILYHWHGGTITRRVVNLMARAPELQVAVSPADAEKYGLLHGEKIKVTSRRGVLTGVALVTDRMRDGEIFIPFVKLSESAANFLTNSAYDPMSKIPEYKVCAVSIEPAYQGISETSS